ncbi:RpiR family transcriptional regulator, partial [Streptomyces sp. TRM76130]|nr:RpiR family transcriptional regulator [Streptomyces sp. TRM76130]
MVPVAFAVTAAATAVVVGGRNRRVRKTAADRQEPLFD